MNRVVSVRTMQVGGLAIMAAALSCQAQIVRIDSSSAGAAIARLAADEFRGATNNPPILATGISGRAMRRLCANQVDLAYLERPIALEELAQCQKTGVAFVEIPLALDAVTVVVNRGNKFVSTLSTSELKRMWESAAQGKVHRWNQVSPRFPDAPLKLLGPDDQLDPANTFTEAILGRGQKARRDYASSVDDSVLVQGVARDVNTLAYMSYQAYHDNRSKLRAVAIRAGDGDSVSPSPEALASGAYAALARPLFLYVSAGALDRSAVREFAEFTLTAAPHLVQEAGYLPLSSTAYRLGLAHVRGRTPGTAWEGKIPIAVTPAEAERRLAAL
jgi:phosphate transport system substrate-binding protein